jgi:hypothetical protein
LNTHSEQKNKWILCNIVLNNLPKSAFFYKRCSARDLLKAIRKSKEEHENHKLCGFTGILNKIAARTDS